ncbi:hypothetical protein EIP86_005734 [Pleurotus ostreatoroseus]|nr:hypothetical protein EIP86_005734 [Pleurotus ostreatoroseus]
MSDLTDGPYNIQNLEFNIVLGTTARTSHANADAGHDTGNAAKGLPRQLAVVQAGTAPPTFNVKQRDSDGLYEISLDSRTCFHLNGKVAAQEGQPFGWTLIPRPDIGPTVYNIATGKKQWFLSSGDAYTLVEAKEPSKAKPKAASEVATEADCSCDEKESQYLWNFSPA